MGRFITNLIAQRRLNASLSKPGEDPNGWLLRFHELAEDGPLSLSEKEAHDELTRQMAKVQSLMQHIKEADRKFGLSKEYIAESKLRARAKENGEIGGEQWSAPPETAFDHDEDVMGD